MPKCSQVRGKCVRDLCSHLQGVALPPGHLSSHCLIPGRGIILGIASSLQGPSGSWKNREQMPPGAWKSSPTRAPVSQGPPPWDWAGWVCLCLSCPDQGTDIHVLGQAPRGGRSGPEFVVSERKCVRKALAHKKSLLLVREPVMAKCYLSILAKHLNIHQLPMLASSRSLTAVNVLELSGTVSPPRFMGNVGAEGSFPGGAGSQWCHRSSAASARLLQQRVRSGHSCWCYAVGAGLRGLDSG